MILDMIEYRRILHVLDLNKSVEDSRLRFCYYSCRGCERSLYKMLYSTSESRHVYRGTWDKWGKMDCLQVTITHLSSHYLRCKIT